MPRAAELDRMPVHQPHPCMRVCSFVSSFVRAVSFALVVGLSMGPGPAWAAETKPPAEPAPKPKPSKPSSLTGNALPKCEAGTFAAGNICKPAVPGFYAPSGALYPVACPEGMTSKAGSRSQSECYPEDGSPPPPPAAADKKKGAH